MQKQRGMTFIGWVIVLAIIGIFAMTIIRLAPVFLEYSKVSASLDGARDSLSGTDNVDIRSVRSAIGKRFNIEAVNIIKPKDVKVANSDNGVMASATYSHVVPFISNVSFKVDFDKSVEITR